MMSPSPPRWIALLGVATAAYACNVYTEDLLTGAVETGGATTGGETDTGGTGGAAHTGGSGGVSPPSPTGGTTPVTGGIGGSSGGGDAAGGSTGGSGAVPTGGVPPTGGSTGGQALGGTATGGEIATGGLEAGGTPTGGVTDTGGAGGGAGGVPTGGVTDTGGAGGVPTGGVTDTGGAGGVPTRTYALIDDLEHTAAALPDNPAGAEGVWYTFADDSGGTMSTDPGDPLVPEEITDGTRTGSAMHVTSTGFTDYGSGFGFDLNNPSGDKAAFDARPYTGLAFYIRAGTGGVDDDVIRMNLPIVAISTPSNGGTCEADCDNAHGYNVPVTSSWVEHHIAFADMTQQSGWGFEADFDLSTLLAIQFQKGGDSNFDVWVDELRFYVE